MPSDASATRAGTLKQIVDALGREPSFQVLAVDGLGWICPYTGHLVDAPFGWQEPAKAWLLEQEPWKTRKPMPLVELQRQRWRLWLRAHVENDGRLRLFGGDGRWLNPFTAHWVRLGFKPGDAPEVFIEHAAAVLAGCAEAQAGTPLDRDRLDAVMHERSLSGSRAAVEATPQRGARRVGPDESSLRLEGDETAAMQRSLERMLPDLPPVAGLALAAHHEPAHDGGNDFHVAGHLADGRLFLAVGSVLGGGTPYALAMPVALKVAMGGLAAAHGPLDILRRVGATMRAMLAAGQGIGMHALVYDPATRGCLSVCAGLRPAVRLNLARRDVLTRIGEPGPALVQVAEADLGRELRGVQFTCEPGDTLVLWSDGLPRAANLHRQPYGDHRAMAVLVGHAQLGLDDLIARVANEARDWTSDVFSQDVTILGLRLDG